jgi:hypothetical protein
MFKSDFYDDEFEIVEKFFRKQGVDEKDNGY